MNERRRKCEENARNHSTCSNCLKEGAIRVDINTEAVLTEQLCVSKVLRSMIRANSCVGQPKDAHLPELLLDHITAT
jgi:hypothetical protein